MVAGLESSTLNGERLKSNSGFESFLFPINRSHLQTDLGYCLGGVFDKNCRITKTNMDCKEEISDSDSGIILNSGECFHFYVNDKKDIFISITHES